MPPRKSDASKSSLTADTVPTQPSSTASAKDTTAPPNDTQTTSAPAEKPSKASGSSAGKDASKEGGSSSNAVTIEDLNLPKSIVTRLAKSAIPPGSQLQGNVVLALQKGSTVFINYLAGLANEYAQADGRKTISPHDVLRSIEDLGLEWNIEQQWRKKLDAEFEKFNEIQTEKRNTYKKKAAEGKANKSMDASTLSVGEGTKGDGDDGEARASKKARLEEGADTTMGDGDEDDNAVDETMGDNEDQEAEDDEVEEEEEEGEEDGDGEQPEGDDTQEREEERDEALDNGEDSD